MSEQKMERMQVTKELMNKIHACGQEILDEFVRICTDNNLKYYLIAGTLLGSVRHQGPIPWDDDVDVCMPRADYEKFKEIMLNRPDGEIYHIHCRENDTAYPSRLSRLMKRDTVYRNRAWSNRNMRYSELWLDIFPLDDAPSAEDQQYQKFAQRMDFIKTLCFNKVSNDTKKMSYKSKLLHGVLKLLPMKLLVSLDEKMMRKYQGRGCDCYMNWGSKYGYIKQTMPKAWYEPSTEVLYSGKYYSAPGQWDKVLTNIYGDYMTPPPKDEQIGHDAIDIQV